MSQINNKTLGKAVLYIFSKIDEHIELEDISANLNLSVSSLKRLFLQGTNQTPGAFIRTLKMETAYSRLQTNDESIIEIALSLGFSNHSAFSRRFRETFGHPPSTVKEQTHNLSYYTKTTPLTEPIINELLDIPLHCITQQGPYLDSAQKAWQQLESLLPPKTLSDDFTGFFVGIGHDNPHDQGIEADKVRFSACIAEPRITIPSTKLLPSLLG
ncbi:MAG TPA: helix-turn-helix domain-containing protein, partial [Chromatiaceae bacterium]|nr:helix-turn-helix domain-containing protein [Chromatiaceae bacterium]